MRFAPIIVLAFTLPAIAQEPVVVKGKTGSIIRLDSAAKGEVAWAVDERLEGEDRCYRDLAAKRLIVVPAQAGRYVCWLFQKDAGTITKFVVIAEGGPAPPGPEPQPQTLAEKIKLAFEADKADGKGTAADAVKLGKIYVMLSEQTDQVWISTVGQSHDVIHIIAENNIKGGLLPSTRKICEDHIRVAVALPDATVLTPAIRGRFKAALVDVSSALLGAPTPPGPDPGPTSPIRVMIVYESAQRTPELTNVISGAKVRDYMTAKGTKDGVTPAFRAYDKDVGPGKTAFQWERDLFARPRQSIPWLIVQRFDGRVVHEGPVPSGEPEKTLAILQKFGG